jgi:hypothetical protein
MRIIAVIFLLLFETPLRAEMVCPKDTAGCLSLDRFQCSNVANEKCINRICYNQDAGWMIVWQENTPYLYCHAGSEAVNALKAAHSMCEYYTDKFPSKQTGDHDPHDCGDHPVSK